MRVIDAINKETDKLYYETHIEFRTKLPGEEDIFTGFCVMDKAGKVIDSDGDTYSPNDVISNYELWYYNEKPCLTCWYESEWL